MLFETHAHVSDPQFDSDRESALRRAKESGVDRMVEIAESRERWEQAQSLCASKEGPEIFWACGFHPHYAQSEGSFDFETMKKAAADPACVAVGEVGLDYFKSAAPKESQMSLFRRCLEIAAQLEKPVIVHCREAQADTVRILKSFYSGLSASHFSVGVIHCFSGDLNFAEACLSLGFYLGVDGPITYPSAKVLREVISQVPPERIVLETDSPYLPPQPFRGKRNEPSYITHVAEKLGELLGKTAEEIGQITHQNASRLFRIKQ